MPDTALPRDPSGNAVGSFQGDSSGDVTPSKGDETAFTQHVSLWVYNTGTLEWEKMTQPVVQGDITAHVDDLEQYTLDKLDQYKLSDYLFSGTDIYLGYLEKDGAWYIKKIATSTGQVRYIAGGSSYDFSDPAGLSYDTFSATF